MFRLYTFERTQNNNGGGTTFFERLNLFSPLNSLPSAVPEIRDHTDIERKEYMESCSTVLFDLMRADGNGSGWVVM